MRKSGAVVAYSNKKSLLFILKACEGADKLLTEKGEREFTNFVREITEKVENPLDVLDYYALVKKLFKALKSELGIEKAGILIYDIENSYPLHKEEGLERLLYLIESETVWEKPVLAYSKCLEDTPILKIYDLDRNEAYEPLAV
ncbi:MAG TPA: hypothetical protein EYH37_00045 [Aquifex aeolicus]|uniref:Uncharacterized protein n=1 Tax=Aquifex aeolicus TaxID=63363 RepID=A0A9D1CEV6_AQUAO|nr:hypothetical protein [Aquifex aeolicus]